jgi:putative flippase GtrA
MPLSLLRLFGKHQIAALVATGVDFGAMIALVELAHLAPPVATVGGAVCGGVTNFAIGRTWAFRGVHRGSLHGQAARYAAVSFGGALLNGALVAVVLAVAAAMPYVAARMLVAALVSVAYSFPMHSRVVFRTGKTAENAETMGAPALVAPRDPD